MAEKVHLSKTTLWKIMDHFVQAGLVLNIGKDTATEELGKKPELYRFNESFGYVITITIYADSVLLALTDARATVFYKEVVYIRENEALDLIVDLVARFIARWQEPGAPNFPSSARLLGIVVACSGVVDSEHGKSMTSSRFHSWPTDAPIVDLIREKVEFKAPFFIDNFCRYFAFAEKTLGCAKDKANIIDVVALTQGVGAGIIAEGRMKRGPRFLSGEIGHMLLDPSDTEICHCGGRGCFEPLVSVQRLIAKAADGRAEHASSAIYADGEETPTLQAIFDAANAGDDWARELMDVVIRWFAVALGNANLVFNAEIVIISGVYTDAGPYFLDKLREEIESTSLLRLKRGFDIRYSTFDEEGALRGGASYVLHDYFDRKFEY